MTLEEFYAFAHQMAEEFRKRDLLSCSERILSALSIGSSTLEIMGAVMIVLKEYQNEIGTFGFSNNLDDAIDFVNDSYGRPAEHRRSGKKRG